MNAVAVNPQLANGLALAGRVLLALIFIVSGAGKIPGWEGTAGYMASKGLPMVPLLLAATIAIELGGGLMIAAGWKARWAAIAIFVFLIPVTFIFHAFWGIDAAQAQGQMTHFLKNVSIMGGLLLVAAYGPGAWSVDRR